MTYLKNCFLSSCVVGIVLTGGLLYQGYVIGAVAYAPITIDPQPYIEVAIENPLNFGAFELNPGISDVTEVAVSSDGLTKIPLTIVPEGDSTFQTSSVTIVLPSSANSNASIVHKGAVKKGTWSAGEITLTGLGLGSIDHNYFSVAVRFLPYSDIFTLSEVTIRYEKYKYGEVTDVNEVLSEQDIDNLGEKPHYMKMRTVADGVTSQTLKFGGKLMVDIKKFLETYDYGMKHNEVIGYLLIDVLYTGFLTGVDDPNSPYYKPDVSDGVIHRR